MQPPSVKTGGSSCLGGDGTADERGWTQMVYSWGQEHADEKSEGKKSACCGRGGDARDEASEDGAGDQPVDGGELGGGHGGGEGELREVNGEADAGGRAAAAAQIGVRFLDSRGEWASGAGAIEGTSD